MIYLIFINFAAANKDKSDVVRKQKISRGLTKRDAADRCRSSQQQNFNQIILKLKQAYGS